MLDDVLRLVTPDRPDTLIASSAQARLAQVMAQLPHLPIFGFECHLSSDRVDLAVQLRRQTLTSAATSTLLDLDTPDEMLWSSVVSLAQEESTRFMWAEFDLDASAEQDKPPTPAVFVSVDDGTVINGCALPPLQRALAKLGVADNDSRSRLLEKIYSNLLPSWRVTHAGLMLSRPDDGLRVEIDIAKSPGMEVTDALSAMGWPGDTGDRGGTGKAASIIDALHLSSDAVAVSLDLVDHVGPRLGIIAGFKRPNLLGTPERWHKLLQWFVDNGLCTSAQREAAVGWQGRDCASTAGDRWPVELAARDAAYEGLLSSVVHRGCSHLKLSVEGGVVGGPKLYLACLTASEPWVAST